ncbi:MULTISPECIES: cobalamin-binding protein [Massilia]|uniref:Periplasmic binding family protein n=1 Tax=Massilia timonae TaxID=47229 RepID=A0A1S2NHI5_9BURK|nr:MULTISPECIES: cobalamin-binding protein [Massilia]OIJ43872.1 periplasmic binding family protein [Massilia timonae]QYG01015.1 cobalamin-binding protein [Massilia sp. NP310]
MKKAMLLAGLAGLAAAGLAAQAQAAITVKDDAGLTVTLAKPALRVVSMAPSVTELLFAAGGGNQIVGAVNYSDYPEAAKRIPRIGSNREIDMELLISLKPDLIVAWRHNSSERQIEMVRRLGVPVFQSDPQTLDGIPDAVLRLGQLLGTDAAARTTATQLREQLAGLRAKYANRSTVRTFYQVWDKPLYTLSGKHILTDAMKLCGGENIFDKLTVTAPIVSIESVLQANPEAIIATAEKNYGGVELWKPYGTLAAVRSNNLFTLDGHLLNRAGPRMVQGTAAMCEVLEQARQRRSR